MAISKITLNGVTQMDVTGKTVTSGTMLNGTTALKNDGTDITGNIETKISADLTASGATVTAPAGYYESAATKSVVSGTEGTPVATKGSAKIGSWELGSITIGGGDTSLSTRMRTNGYIELTNQIDISSTGTAEFSVRAYKADYSFVQTDITWHSGTINVDAFLQTYSSYSQIKYIRFNARYSTDATVVVSELEQLITVTDHTLSITPSVTNSAGYISGGTHTGSSVSVTASELVSGTKSITSSGTTDVTNYASVSAVAGTATVPASISGTGASVSTGTNTLTFTKTVSITPSVTAGYVSSGTAGNSSVSLTATVNTRSSSDLTVSGVTVTAPSGYYSSDTSIDLAIDNKLPDFATYSTTTLRGVTFTWTNGQCAIAGANTGTNPSYNILYSSMTVLPSALVAGNSYYLGLKWNRTPTAYVRVYCYDSQGSAILNKIVRSGGEVITIPDNAVGFTLRVEVAKDESGADGDILKDIILLSIT